ncbi:MAG: carbohydrate binding family 9 domain-containing protein [Deltaproteobacteria bacterium]|nr:carbohydrate binding family 9 domain-containing protein [Deltaproteobacteria bacterium]
MSSRVGWFAIVAIALGASRARADQPAPLKTIALGQVDGPVHIDGALDEPTWQRATWTSDFADKEPIYGAAPAHPMQVAIARDDHALYVAARMESGGDPVAAPLTRRDDTSQAERFIVSLDPYRTRRFAYSFAVTAAGTRADWIHTDDDERARDASWNPVWSAAVHRGATGWTAELRIPLGQLRYPAGAAAWGIDFNRYVPPTHEDVFWIAVPRDRTAWASFFGELRDTAAIAPARRFELMPYAAAGVEVTEAPSGQLGRAARPLGNVGADARLGLGAGLTLDATINPDFGQVEADPAVVNLTAFEVRLPERRPFFVEGQTIFQTAVRNYFYSRRIGGIPRTTLDADEVDAPSQTRILGAAKLTGRAGDHTNVGAIAAVTGPADAAIVVGGARSEVRIAPTTAWGVGRVERELGGAGASIGASATAVARDLDPALAMQLVRTALTGGVDLRLRPRGGAYELTADIGGSLIAGEPAAIGAVATASAHYFQRPDQPHVRLDPTARTMAGWCADLGAAHRGGAWQWSTGVTAESPGLETNDAGTLMSADDLDGFVEIGRVETDPGDRLQSWRIGGGVEGGWNFGGVRKPAAVHTDVSFSLPSFAGASAQAIANLPGLSDDLTRGGPLMAEGAGGSLVVNANGVPNRPVTWNATGQVNWHQTRARGGQASATMTILPSERVRLSITPRAVWQRIAQQYLTTVSDAGGGAATFGSRYLFAALDQREVAAQLRVGVALTPDLAIDAYVEPFVSVGRFTGIGELAAARTHDVRRYTQTARGDGTVAITDGTAFAIDDPDFTAVSLRSTLVLRWELAPGSVLWAVWQEQRGDNRLGARWDASLAGRPFTTAGEHVLAVKLAWWFAP